MCPTPSGKPGCVRSNAWHDSSRRSQDRRGSRYKPMTSQRTACHWRAWFASNAVWSVPTPNARRWPLTPRPPTPWSACSSAAVPVPHLRDHLFHPGGIVPRRPRPRLSRNPSSPSRSNLCDHLFTQTMLTPSASATSCCLISRARRSMILARDGLVRCVLGTRRCSSSWRYDALVPP